jgi:hypothetical protein
MDNPLSNYFRTPSIYITLPSGGIFYPNGTIDMPPNNELPVMAMTAVDEITSRTPDALYNGSSMVNVIQSCIPNIKNAWEMPIIDLDTILIAIRIASYTHELEIDTKCPKCSEEGSYTLDLRVINDNLKTPDYQTELNIGDLKILFKPLSYKQVNEANIITFEKQKLTTILEDSAISEEDKVKLLSESFNKISELSLNTLAMNINYIQTPQSVVREYEFIVDFLKNCELGIYEKIHEHVSNLKDGTEFEPLHIKCQQCQHEYNQPFTLDMSFFLGHD